VELGAAFGIVFATDPIDEDSISIGADNGRLVFWRRGVVFDRIVHWPTLAKLPVAYICERTTAATVPRQTFKHLSVRASVPSEVVVTVAHARG
jgi:hypothetical protein